MSETPPPTPDDLDGLSFAERVQRVVAAIPEGRVTSYGAVAAICGAPRAARGVGAVLNGLAPEEEVPWWRVVNRIGVLSIPAELGRRTLQRTLLVAEGVAFRTENQVEMERHLWPAGDEVD